MAIKSLVVHIRSDIMMGKCNYANIGSDNKFNCASPTVCRFPHFWCKTLINFFKILY